MSFLRIKPPFLFLLLLLARNPWNVNAASSNTCTSEQESCSSCSNATDLTNRIQKSLPPSSTTPTPFIHSIRGTIDNVLSPSTCHKLTTTFSPTDFTHNSGYDTEKKSYSGLDLTDLSKSFASQEEYEWFLSIREHVRLKTEEALGLCPHTLHVHYTHLAQKQEGGIHAPHADNCYHSYHYNQEENASVAKCLKDQPHPYPKRIAASITFLNSPKAGNFNGGEFYWADLADGEPAVVVTPKEGRMTFFTAGVENLHGALPVLRSDDSEINDTPRRLSLAMWYVIDSNLAEVIPPFVGKSAEINKPEEEEEIIDTPNQKLLLKIPITSMKTSALKLSLWLHLVKQQSNPYPKSWQANEGSHTNMLTMLYKDHTAMFSITFLKRSIAIHRHVDLQQSAASLQYQLQESVMLHDLLDELEVIAFGDGGGENGGEGGERIEEGDRLLVMEEGIVEEARKSLPARRSGR